MNKRYVLNGEEFMWVTPSVNLMNSRMLSDIVNSDERQLVVSLETGVLTTHKYPKKKIPEDVVIYFHYDNDTYVKLSHNVDEALTRISKLKLYSSDGEVIVKNSLRKITYVGNWVNFERAMKQLYKDLAEEA
jgi:Ribonuclease G/E